MKDAEYQKARENKNQVLRQSFLDNLDLEDATHYIEKICYDSELGVLGINYKGQIIKSQNILMQTFPSFKSKLRLKKGKSIIKLFASVFDQVKTLDNFLSLLIDHEGCHAKDNYSLRIPFSRRKSEFYLLRDILAYDFQLRRINNGKRVVTSEFKIAIEKKYREKYNDFFFIPNQYSREIVLFQRHKNNLLKK